MKGYHYLLIILFYLSSFSCSKKTSPPVNESTISNVKTTLSNGNGFDYQTHYIEGTNSRKGIVILAVGDGGTVKDGLLNDISKHLAAKGYVAITTTYRAMTGDYTNWMIRFKEDIESIISQSIQTYQIPRNKVVIGGLSRGGNLTYGLILPGQMGNTPPIAGIKGAILACAGGDEWKGSAVLYPVLFMNNKIDSQVGTTNADSFAMGLNNNQNPNVKALSKTLIIPGSGHCTDSNKYKEFILTNIDSWF